MNTMEYPDDSDSSDEDYVPENAPAENPMKVLRKNRKRLKKKRRNKKKTYGQLFKKETNFKARPINVQNTKDNNTKENENIEQKKVPEKIKVTEIFEFAGEEIKVEKEVPVNSTSARLSNKASGSDPPKRGRGKAGGIGSVLNQLGKKQKITTLEKSKLDWDKFKKEENLEEELHNFNKGKDGYLDRQDFLQRTDVRRFEIERDIRNAERNKRMNNL
ncbi:bucentaur related [Holotrichia oblita]|uniref:Bucentaur related n=1 Tax=Holotrichia oblita TaxID=644536 RepID=A0ACB9TSY5_HOLOL|nr:bucentaur related [Holotrichia oblita]